MAWIILLIRGLIARRGFELLVQDIRNERKELRRKKALGAPYVPKEPDPDRPTTVFFLLGFIAFLAWLIANGMHVRRWIVGSLLYGAILLAFGGIIAAGRAAMRSR